MVTFPPLMPKVAWWQEFLREYKNTRDLATAIKEANRIAGHPKEFGRYTLHDRKGTPILLSVPVEGGGRLLRNYNHLDNLKLSDHGNWRSVHLGALEANLGRKPFYRHLIPAIQNIYFDRNIETLEEFNTAIFRSLLSFLIQGVTPQDIEKYDGADPVKERGHEISSLLKGDEAIIESLCDYGPEILLGIVR